MKKFDALTTSQYRGALHKYSLDTITVNPLDKGSSSNAMDKITQHNLITNYSLAVSGGDENGKILAFLLASPTPGFLKTNNMDKDICTFAGADKVLDKKQ